jgi:hypothetical protein
LSLKDEVLKILIDALQGGKSSSSGPAVVDYSEPEPPKKPKPKYPAGSQEWFKALPPPNHDGVDMNDLRRAADRGRQKPPRRPGQQRQHWSGFHWFYD